MAEDQAQEPRMEGDPGEEVPRRFHNNNRRYADAPLILPEDLTRYTRVYVYCWPRYLAPEGHFFTANVERANPDEEYVWLNGFVGFPLPRWEYYPVHRSRIYLDRHTLFLTTGYSRHMLGGRPRRLEEALELYRAANEAWQEHMFWRNVMQINNALTAEHGDAPPEPVHPIFDVRVDESGHIFPVREEIRIPNFPAQDSEFLQVRPVEPIAHLDRRPEAPVDIRLANENVVERCNVQIMNGIRNLVNEKLDDVFERFRQSGVNVSPLAATRRLVGTLEGMVDFFPNSFEAQSAVMSRQSRDIKGSNDLNDVLAEVTPPNLQSGNNSVNAFSFCYICKTQLNSCQQLANHLRQTHVMRTLAMTCGDATCTALMPTYRELRNHLSQAHQWSVERIDEYLEHDPTTRLVRYSKRKQYGDDKLQRVRHVFELGFPPRKVRHVLVEEVDDDEELDYPDVEEEEASVNLHDTMPGRNRRNDDEEDHGGAAAPAQIEA